MRRTSSSGRDLPFPSSASLYWSSACASSVSMRWKASLRSFPTEIAPWFSSRKEFEPSTSLPSITARSSVPGVA